MTAGLDALLLFTLSLPWPLLFSISPGETPYWLFGLYFLLLVFYILVDLKILIVLPERKRWWVKLMLVAGVIIIAAGGPLVTSIITRIGAPPEFEVHDIILQLESAMRYLLDGKNPYAATYFGTPMEKWRYAELGVQATNPALYHFVMPPWYLIFPFFFYVPFISFLGFFDARIPLLFTFFGTLFVLARWVKDPLKRLYILILTAFHPVLFGYLREGRSDHFALFWFTLAMFFLSRKRYILGGCIYGLALMSKQTIWVSVPFVFVYLWQNTGGSQRNAIWKSVSSACITSAVLVVPFLLWDASAFLQSTVGFLAGTVLHSYPISGYGLGMLLYDMRYIQDIHSYYPFFLWQIAVGVPALFILLRWLKKNATPGNVYVSYGLFLFLFWYVSRYFNNSHIGYISLLVAIGYLL